MVNYNFLGVLDIPQKIPISHKIVSKLVEKSDPDSTIEYRENKLSTRDKKLLYSIKDFFSNEESFLIAKIEYENKEKRFLELTSYTVEKLDILYNKHELNFKDIEAKQIEKYIESDDIENLIFILDDNTKTIKSTREGCYRRANLLLSIWEDITKNLLLEINNFSHRGMKIVSNSLRVKFLPQIEEMKLALKLKMVEDSSSRSSIEQQLRTMVKQVEEDLLSGLTQDQIKLFEKLNSNPKKNELIKLLRSPKSLENLMELILSDFIQIIIVKKELQVL
ncbi:MAG: hypothetical protein HeimC2_04330 [Candidatus Heimdallarchaeota archaeon LC_2]|nr:MAG: hypothetical protein HeimC2_04330 [Candidatus Heimdallarchaeota archaeon LC_2]